MSAAGSPFSSTFRRQPATKLIVHAVLIVASLSFCFPMLWMLSTSLKPIEQAMVFPPQLVPETIQWRNYAETVRYIPFWSYTLNTLLICLLSAFGTTVSSALVAYSFTRLDWAGR